MLHCTWKRSIRLERERVFNLRLTTIEYQELVSLLESQDAEVPPELLNNIAVLYHIEADAINSFFMGRFEVNCPINESDTSEAHFLEVLDAAETLYGKAVAILASPDFSADSSRTTALKTTIKFNVARLYETKGQTEKAVEKYNELLQSTPAFIDCMLRLGSISEQSKDTETALTYYGDAISMDPTNISAWFMVGNLHFKKKNYRVARKSFEKVLTLRRHDTYALCSAGNLCLIFARGDPNLQTVS